MRKNATIGTWCVAMIAMLVVGCASKPEVLPTTTHLPGEAKNVKFYESEPMKYEVLGMINLPVAPGASWDDRGNANAGFLKFQEEAAKMGANGILLKVPEGKGNVVVGAGYKGTMYHVPMMMDGEKRTAMGQAIFVVEE